MKIFEKIDIYNITLKHGIEYQLQECQTTYCISD
jgi:hypothetical protein